MADYVTIANLAASLLGEDDQLRSPDDDTHLGRSVAAVWDMVRRAALRDHSWNFAMQRVELAALDPATLPGGAVAWPFQSAFRLPAESLRVIEVYGCSARHDYQVEGQTILANIAGPLRLRFIADIAEPALWDDLFADAFAKRLAYQIADRITGDRGRQASAWDAYRASLREAKRVDARENPQVPFEATDWELARFGGGSRPPYGIPTGYPT